MELKYKAEKQIIQIKYKYLKSALKYSTLVNVLSYVTSPVHYSSNRPLTSAAAVFVFLHEAELQHLLTPAW